jgi:hypothetical protein
MRWEWVKTQIASWFGSKSASCDSPLQADVVQTMSRLARALDGQRAEVAKPALAFLLIRVCRASGDEELATSFERAMLRVVSSAAQTRGG